MKKTGDKNINIPAVLDPGKFLEGEGKVLDLGTEGWIPGDTA